MYSSRYSDISGIDAQEDMLKSMSPEQLRQFATMHSDDVIAMSLVSALQSERNKAPPAQQGQQGPQPKVLEQFVQSLPAEESGLAALPAQNMAMADGGIVGYASGGLPEREPNESFSDYRNRAIAFQDAEMQAEDAAKRAQIEQERLAELQRRGGPRQSPFVQATPYSQPAAPPPAAAAQVPPANVAPPAAPPPSDKAPPRGLEALSGSANYRTEKRGGAGAGSAMDMGALYKQAQTTAGVGSESDPYAAQRAEILRSRQEQGRREEADVEQKAKGLEALSTKREARIGARESALEAQGKTDQGMAIINAGLTMMQSSGRGLAGIAEGASAGMKQYGESLKLSKAERQKIEEAKDAYDEFKFNADSMTQKERTAAKNKTDEAANIMAEKSIDAIAAERKISREAAKEIFSKTVEAQIAAARNATEIQAAGIRASATGGGTDKQRIAALRAEQTSLIAKMKTLVPYGPTKNAHAQAVKDLATVEAELAKISRPDTIATVPDAEASAQNRPPLGAFQK